MENYKSYTFDERINIQLKEELYNAIWAMAMDAKTLEIECEDTVMIIALCYNPHLVRQHNDEYTNQIHHYKYLNAFAKKHDSFLVDQLGKHCMHAFKIYNAFKY